MPWGHGDDYQWFNGDDYDFFDFSEFLWGKKVVETFSEPRMHEQTMCVYIYIYVCVCDIYIYTVNK